jgi:hypothetical protein
MLPAREAFWRPSNQKASSTSTSRFSARRARSGRGCGDSSPVRSGLNAPPATCARQSSTSCSTVQAQKGSGEVLSLEPLSTLVVEPRVVRKVFKDTDATALWLVVGAPPEAVDTRAMADEQLTDLYPAGPRALPPEVQHLPPEARGGATEVTPR